MKRRYITTSFNPMSEVKYNLILETELAARLRWLIRIRWFAVAGVFAAVSAARLIPAELPFVYLYAGGAVLLAANLFYGIYNRTLALPSAPAAQWAARAGLFAAVQIVVDLVLLTYLLYFSGGLWNPFVLFFVFHMVISSILLSNRSAYAMAAAASVFIGTLGFGQYGNVFPYYPLWPGTSTPPVLWPTFGVFIAASLTLFATVYMTTTIVNKMRENSRKLEEANNRLMQQDKLKSQYVLTVSHQLKAPLSAIQSCLKVVLEKMTGSVSEKSREMIARAEARTVTLLHFVRHLLDLSKIKSADKMEKSHLSITEIAARATAKVKDRAAAKKIELKTAGFPASASQIYANEEALEHIFDNLLRNAVKYTPRGGTVELRICEKDDVYLIKVIDTGIGVPDGQEKKIFEDFYRADNACSLIKNGTGLGLSIVKQAAAAHGGKVWVRSRPGRGSSFFCSLAKG